MSHAGPDDPPPDSGQGGDGGSTDQQPYSPYPDNWDAPSRPAANPPSQQSPYPPPSPYGEPTPYAQADPYALPSPYAQASAYGQTNPYGEQSPYAAPTAPGSPANPYAGPLSTKPTFGFGGYASWLTRVGAYLIDAILGTIAALPLWLGYVQLFSDSTTTTDANGVRHVEFHSSGTITAFIWIGILTSTAFQIWNIYIRQGRTGATYGKSVMAVRLVNAEMQPIGPGWAFLRNLLHILDTLPCGIGWLWPIWDSRRQTFADKVMNTFVIHATAQPPPLYPPQVHLSRPPY